MEVIPDPSHGGGIGHVLGAIEFPGSKSVTAACFGGEGLTDLYVTTAKLFDTEGDTAGSLFVVKNVRSHAEGNPKVVGTMCREAAKGVAK